MNALPDLLPSAPKALEILAKLEEEVDAAVNFDDIDEIAERA